MKRAAVIGVGYLGRYHAEKYARSQAADLCAVVDIVRSKAERTAEEFGCRALEDYRALPEMGVECVSVVCTTSEHFEISRWLLENGIDVLVEKPIASTVEEARELIEVAHTRGRVLQVGHVERFNPAFRAVKDVLHNPWFFEVQRIAPFVGRGCDMDVVSDLMIHDIDIIAHLIERPIESVDAVGVPVLTDSIDIANARLGFRGGITANITASRAAFKSERTIRIFQPDLYVSLDFDKKKLRVCRKTDERDERGYPKIEVEECVVGERDALADEIESFVEVVTTRGTPVVSGADGLRALEMVEQVRESCVRARGFLELNRLTTTADAELSEFKAIINE